MSFSALSASLLARENLIPEGLDATNNRVFSQVTTGGTYFAAVSGPIGPFGNPVLQTQDGKAVQAVSGRTGMPWFPVNSASVKCRFYVPPGAGHNIAANVVERNAALTQTTTQICSHLTTTRKIGTLTSPAGTFDVYEWTVTWKPDSIEWSMYASLNYTSLAGITLWAGMWAIPGDQNFADPGIVYNRKIPSYGIPDPFISTQIQAALDAPSVYTPPTPSSPAAYLRMFGANDTGIMIDVYDWTATGNTAYLTRTIPLLDAYRDLRDDKLATPLVDFTGVVRKAWGADAYQSLTDGVYASGTNLASPPHPGVIAHWPLHMAATVWPALRWVEAVNNSKTVDATLVTKAAEVKIWALEALHEFDSQFATETHITNTDPNPLQAGEGRYFLKYDPSKAGALREGYLYVPGSTELPLNMDMFVAAALYVAARVTRGTANTASAESLEFLNKADRILRRYKRSLYRGIGFLGSYYSRQGTWVASGYTASTSGSPSFNGWTGYTTIAAGASGSQTVGEDSDHMCYNLRAIAEYRKTSQNVILTQDDLNGIAGQFFAFWPHWSAQRARYYLDTPTGVYLNNLTLVAGPPDAIWAELADVEPRIAKWLREWYRNPPTVAFTRAGTVGMLLSRNILL
jgi:hypothetical protein